MPKKILMLISEGINTDEGLLRESGMEAGELVVVLEDLCKKGYLTVVDGNEKGMCHAGQFMRADAGIERQYSLTKKGKTLIRC
jgi:hypothetical protein